MGLRWRTRRWLALLVLVVGLPLYIIVAVTILNLLGRPHILVEMLIYIVLGVLWALPFKRLFLGIGQAEPEDERRAREKR